MPTLLPNGINISVADMIALRDAVEDPGEWVRDMIQNKISKSRKRMRSTWVDKLIDDPDVTTIPSDEDVLLDTVSKRPDYKNRRQRDEAGVRRE